MFAASKSGSVDAKDPQFNYVTMLLHGDGTNGAQNNTFLDSSTNNFTITRNGNTTQGTFTPYGDNWSNYLNGSSSLSVNVSGVAAGTSTFTFEAWVYLNAYPASDAAFYDTRSSNGASTTAMQFGVYSTGALKFYDGTETNLGGTVPLNQWVHIALVRNGSNVMTPYINGTATGTTVSSTRNFSDQYFWIGSVPGPASPYINAYLSNLRWVVGTAVYTSNFTPSTTPLTAITNTKILTCQSNRFADNSSNTFAITLNGSPSVQRFSPFSPTTAYSTSVIGGSLYGDGTGDYLSIPYSSSNSLNAGDFTVEAWVYKNSNAAYMAIGGTMTSAAPYNTKWQIIGDSGGTKITWSTDAFLITSSATLYTGSWYHVAFVRSSGTLRLYINGVLDSSSADTRNYNSATDLWVAQVPENVSGRNWNGYITNFRINPTTAVYTAAFTPPTAPLTATTGTSFLLATTNAGILDNAMMNDLETVGNAQISTSVKKYGTGSLAFDGTGDYLVGPSTPQIGLGSGDFTIELWVYLTANFDATGKGLVTASYNTNFAVIGVNTGAGNRIDFYVANTVLNSGANYISLNAWTHLAFVRSSGTTKMYYDGVEKASSASLTGTGAAAAVYVGTLSHDTPRVMTGYIDDLRISKVARYTAAFTPPTAAFADKG